MTFSLVNNKKLNSLVKWIFFLPIGFFLLTAISGANWISFSFVLGFFMSLNSIVVQTLFFGIWISIFFFTLSMFIYVCALVRKISPNVICYFIVTIIYLAVMINSIIKYSNEWVYNDPTLIQIPVWLYIVFFIRELLVILFVGINPRENLL